jgi:transcriptional regulator with XRE-family HTH domain
VGSKQKSPCKDLGYYLRVYRAQRHLTQADLALALNVSVSFLSLIENGKRHPGRVLMAKLRSLIGVPIHVLFGEQD